MKYIPSALIDSASGKIGEVVASTGNGGPYFRRKVTPLNPNSLYQVGVRASLVTLARMWETLTNAQVTAWNSEASLLKAKYPGGYKKKLVGFTLFVQTNQNITLAGGAAISAPIAQVPETGLSIASVTSVGSGATTFTFGPTPVAANTAMVILAAFKKANQKLMRGNLKYIEAVAAAGASPLVITTGINARLGVPVTGNTLYVEAYLINILTGAKSAITAIKATVS